MLPCPGKGGVVSGACVGTGPAKRWPSGWEQSAASRTLTSFATALLRSFKVGGAALGGSGKIYVGANFEFHGCGLGHAIHAEQFTVTNAAQGGEKSLKMIATNVPPCGHCRQFLMEIVEAPDLIFLCGEGRWRLAELLPHVFHFDHDYPYLTHKPHK